MHFTDLQLHKFYFTYKIGTLIFYIWIQLSDKQESRKSKMYSKHSIGKGGPKPNRSATNIFFVEFKVGCTILCSAEGFIYVFRLLESTLFKYILGIF